MIAQSQEHGLSLGQTVPKPLLAAVKARARARGIPYTRFIRETLERAIAPK
jgi:predicted DNA binding CopG/RHH family protein